MIKKKNWNSFSVGSAGVAVGAGWQAYVGLINIACYYIFGIPAGALLGFKFKLGVKGIWSGMLVGTVLQTTILLFLMLRATWQKEVFSTLSCQEPWNVHIHEWYRTNNTLINDAGCASWGASKNMGWINWDSRSFIRIQRWLSQIPNTNIYHLYSNFIAIKYERWETKLILYYLNKNQCQVTADILAFTEVFCL